LKCSGGDMIKFADASKMSVVFMVLSVISFMVSVPYWEMLGLFKLP
jgi:hypothetical protein